MLMIITIIIISLPVLNFSGHSRPSLANIAKLMQNAEPCLRHYQGYDMSKVYCSKYQGTFALSVRQKAKTIIISNLSQLDRSMVNAQAGQDYRKHLMSSVLLKHKPYPELAESIKIYKMRFAPIVKKQSQALFL